MDRSYSDTESVLRLAAGLWAQSDEEGASALLREARSAVPEEPAYAAALGAALDRRGEYLAARDEYLAFTRLGGSPDLVATLSSRMDALRGPTAAPLVERLMETRTLLGHGLDSRWVVALPLLRSPAGEQETAQLAAAATELLVQSLRESRFYVVDWELAQAALQSIESSGAPGDTATALGALLDARRVVLGSVRMEAGDTAVFSLDVTRIEELQLPIPERSSVWLPLGEYARDPTVLSARVFEAMLGAAPRSTSPDLFDRSGPMQRETLLLYGEGLLARQRGDPATALDAVSRAAALAPDNPAVRRTLEEMRADNAFLGATSLPFAEEVLAFARRRGDALYLLRRAGSEGPMPLGVTRHGAAEALGLDRLGSQVFLDFVVTIDGGGP